MSTPEYNSSFSASIKNGVLAGLAGGVVFGIMMAMMGSLAMIASMVGSSSVIVGFLVHMMISAIIGAGFGLIGHRISPGLRPALLTGGVYGMAWWVLGPLVMMPLMMGMTEMVFQVGSMQLMSLMGHVIFGLVTGLAFSKLSSKG